MATQVSQKFTVSNPDQAWAVVSDISKLVACAPGATVTSAESPTKARAQIDIKITIGGDGGTIDGTASLSGKAASMGEGTVEAVLTQLVKGFAGNLGKA